MNYIINDSFCNMYILILSQMAFLTKKKNRTNTFEEESLNCIMTLKSQSHSGTKRW